MPPPLLCISQAVTEEDTKTPDVPAKVSVPWECKFDTWVKK